MHAHVRRKQHQRLERRAKPASPRGAPVRVDHETPVFEPVLRGKSWGKSGDWRKVGKTLWR